MNRKNRIAIEVLGGAVLIAALYFLLPAKKGLVEVDSGYRLTMGTLVRVVAVAADSDTAKKAAGAALEQLYNVDRLMSVHRDDSEISEVNRQAAKKPVRVSKVTFEVLAKAVEFGRISGGAFDITVGPLVELWHSAGEANSPPTDIELADARSKVGYEKLILDANQSSVQFAVEGMKLDLGGIAKGYAVDKAVEAMAGCGAIGGMVDAGGNIRCFGTPPQGKKHFSIGLQDPADTETPVNTGRYLLVLNLTDQSVATSGNYRRFVLIGGKTYSHIISPRTGRSSDELASVTIIAQNATDADALSTAVSVMGRQKGLELIESLPKTEAILISSGPQYSLVKTKGVQQYLAGKTNLTDTGSNNTKQTIKEAAMEKYQVSRAVNPPKLDGDWLGPIWGKVKPLDIKKPMGPQPKYRPKAQAKLLYDDRFLYVIFHVEDKYIRATAQKHQDAVFVDSCVEFFFTPGKDISEGYVNIEVNCGGTVVSRHQTAPKTNPQPLSNDEIEMLKIFHSEPRIVEPEKQQPTTWLIEYRIPYEILERRCPVARLAPGVLWRANFYKCGAKTSNPHRLTWSAIDSTEMNFHQPQFFGTLEFK